MDTAKFFNMPENTVVPFWSWNDRLEKNELLHQIRCMKAAGINGFFMHARGGLLTPYMDEAWMDLTKACIQEAASLGMAAWAYDENGWPSGFADGIVPAQGEAFQQKWLVLHTVTPDFQPNARLIRCFREEKESFTAIDSPEIGSTAISYDINPYYIDTFNADAVQCFIQNTHEKYYQQFPELFGNAMHGFFTDEPQYGNGGIIPWSPVLETRFYTKYGYALSEKLLLLFRDYPGYEQLRADFYNLVAEVFQESFLKQMYDWCDTHNCKLTGHMMNEDSLYGQMNSTAGVMSCYEYFHEPGIDWLGRQIKSPLIAKQLGSAAAQLGRKTLTESFALCGWDVSLNELKWIAQNQFVHGVTSICPHLEAYTIRGYRKRDYPASVFTQLPWFQDANKDFCTYFTRLGGILDSGREHAPLLVIHMLQTAYVHYNPYELQTFWEDEESFAHTVRALSALHIPHHFGDERLMQRHGNVQGDSLQVGQCRYQAVLLPNVVNITENTLRLLLEFAKNGGQVYILGSAPSLVDGRTDSRLQQLEAVASYVDDLQTLKQSISVCEPVKILSSDEENPNIYYCRRDYKDRSCLYYLVNNSDQPQTVTLVLPGYHDVRILDIVNKEDVAANTQFAKGATTAELVFPPYGSYILATQESVHPCDTTASEIESEVIRLQPQFTISKTTPNALTLDCCEYRVDGGQWQPQLPVIKLQNQLLCLKKSCDIEMRFRFTIADLEGISDLQLCVETPEKFQFTLNGEAFSFNTAGCFVDKSILCCPIQDFIKAGENILLIKGRFYQNDNVYRVLFDPNIHETERNKLTYDTELESIFIIGNFSVHMDGDYHYGARRSIFGGRTFTINAPVTEVNIADVTHQGFWFFAGSMDLTQTIELKKQAGKRYFLQLKNLYAPAAAVFVNGHKVGVLAFTPYKLELTPYLQNGANQITLRLYSGNRNLLGPHHKPYGESYLVGPDTFSDNYGWTEPKDQPTWTDNYNFVLFGGEV